MHMLALVRHAVLKFCVTTSYKACSQGFQKGGAKKPANVSVCMHKHARLRRVWQHAPPRNL